MFFVFHAAKVFFAYWVLPLTIVYDLIYINKGKEIMLKKVFCISLIIVLLIIVCVSFFSLFANHDEEVPKKADDTIFFSTVYFNCKLKKDYLTITGLTDTALSLEEIIIPIYIRKKCVAELIIDGEIESSNIKKYIFNTLWLLIWIT